MKGVWVQSHFVELEQTNPFPLYGYGEHPSLWNLYLVFIHNVMGVFQAQQTFQFVRSPGPRGNTLMRASGYFLEFRICPLIVICLPQEHLLLQRELVFIEVVQSFLELVLLVNIHHDVFSRVGVRLLH